MEFTGMTHLELETPGVTGVTDDWPAGITSHVAARRASALGVCPSAAGDDLNLSAGQPTGFAAPGSASLPG